MTIWSAENLPSAAGGSELSVRWLREPDGTFDPAAVLGAATDSRRVRPGDAFIALPGATADGRDYIPDAVAAGSPLIVTEPLSPQQRDAVPSGIPILEVANGPRALWLMAAAHRRLLTGVRIVAVTGSNGKTTTVGLIDAILSRTLRGQRSARSFNNAIGVPLTLLGAQSDDDYLIAEVGTNAPGEIAPLSELLRPDIAVITTVGRSHLEGLGSPEGVAREKAAIITALADAGTFIVPGPTALNAAWMPPSPRAQSVIAALDQAIDTMLGDRRARCRELRFGTIQAGPAANPPTHLRASRPVTGESGMVFDLAVDPDPTLMPYAGRYELPVLGHHNALNAAAAIAVAAALEAGPKAARAGLARAALPAMRLEIIHAALPGATGPGAPSVEIINDAYNANPESMLAALRTATELAAGRRRVAILGDMAELGEDAPALHRELGEHIASERLADQLVLVGRLMMFTAERAAMAMPAESIVTVPLPETRGAPAGVTPAWATLAASQLRPGDLVLLKGSRVMGMERVLDAVLRPQDKAGRTGD